MKGKSGKLLHLTLLKKMGKFLDKNYFLKGFLDGLANPVKAYMPSAITIHFDKDLFKSPRQSFEIDKKNLKKDFNKAIRQFEDESTEQKDSER